MKEIKILISMFVVAIIITIIITVSNLNNIKVTKSTEHKYDINKTVKELDLKTINDYIEYLEYIKEQIKPTSLIRLVEVDKKVANHYRESEVLRSKVGTEVLQNLIYNGYHNLIVTIIKKSQSWRDLPLTAGFKKRFSEKDGCIKELNSFEGYLTGFDLKNKKFSIDKYWVADDAYEKYSKEVVEYMIEYGGAYNVDRYNYEFILDDEGYLDDIIFLGITPHIVEGRYVDEDD